MNDDTVEQLFWPAPARPTSGIRVHGRSRVIELLAEVRIHAADHVPLQRTCSCAWLPGEIARAIFFHRLALIDLPKILLDFIKLGLDAF
jgi:hypothetical protein